MSTIARACASSRRLEDKYPRFRGLNLTWEVREGLIKHKTTYDQPGRAKDFPSKSPSLEAQIANLADELIYGSHDLDDGLDAGLLSEEELRKHVRVFARPRETVRKEHGRIAGGNPPLLHHPLYY